MSVLNPTTWKLIKLRWQHWIWYHISSVSKSIFSWDCSCNGITVFEITNTNINCQSCDYTTATVIISKIYTMSHLTLCIWTVMRNRFVIKFAGSMAENCSEPKVKMAFRDINGWCWKWKMKGENIKDRYDISIGTLICSYGCSIFWQSIFKSHWNAIRIFLTDMDFSQDKENSLKKIFYAVSHIECSPRECVRISFSVSISNHNATKTTENAKKNKQE